MTLELTLANGLPLPVLSLRGKLDGASAPQLAQWLEQHAPAPTIWDLSQLDYVSSAGLRVLLTHEKRLRANGRATTLAGVRASVRDLLSISGLASFWPQTASAAAACAALTSAATPVAAAEFLHGGHRFQRTDRRSADAALVQWQFDQLTPLSLRDLGLAVGRGGLGDTRDDASAQPMRFLATGNVLAMQFADGAGDYLQAAVPQAAFAHVASAIALTGSPSAVVQPIEPVTLTELAAAALFGHESEWLGIAVHGSMGTAAQAAIAILAPGDEPEKTNWIAIEWPSPSTASQPSLEALLQAIGTAEDLRVLTPEATEKLASAVAFVWHAKETTAGNDRILQIEAPAELSEEAEIIARTIYFDCSRIRLNPLVGGFSAATFAVESHDRQGRRLIPTVLKVSSHPFIDREEQAYHDYVRKFILNNSTVIMGRANRGDSAGLRYNFLGITGPGSRLRSLDDVYRQRPITETLRLFEQVAGEILRPWYGQAREQRIALYPAHDPRPLFGDLAAVAGSTLGIDAGAPALDCPPLGRKITNPWWFLSHEWSRRSDWRQHCRVSITHGDLNLNNVLVDEKENLYVIDFSETGERNVAADFARLEPIVTLQSAALASDEELAELLRFHADLHNCSNLFAPDVTSPKANDAFAKCLAMTRLLRRLARDYAGDGATESAYLLPLLQWTLPIVCYRQLTLRHRQLATWVAGLIVERLLRSDHLHR